MNDTRYRSDRHRSDNTDRTDRDTEREGLRERIEAAYREGYADGREDGEQICHGGSADTTETAWAQSNARALIDGAAPAEGQVADAIRRLKCETPARSEWGEGWNEALENVLQILAAAPREQEPDERVRRAVEAELRLSGGAGQLDANECGTPKPPAPGETATDEQVADRRMREEIRT